MADLNLVMSRSKGPRDRPCIFELICEVAMNADRVGLDRPVHEFGHECNVQRRINAATQEHTERSLRRWYHAYCKRIKSPVRYPARAHIGRSLTKKSLNEKRQTFQQSYVRLSISAARLLRVFRPAIIEMPLAAMLVSRHVNNGTLSLSKHGDMEEYFSGRRLYGDDFSSQEIEAWYRDEQNAYFDLHTQMRESGYYDYHALNWMHGYSQLPRGNLGRVLSFGGANGEELRPIARRAESIVIVEPATYPVSHLDGTAVRYRRPVPSGHLPAEDEEFDVLTCFGALHHVPNVTSVIQEFGRVTRKGGIALVREPAITMGDWRRPRQGLTRRERGIPPAILEDAFGKAGFEIRRRRRCVHPLTPRIGRLLRVSWFNSPLITAVDHLLSRMTPWPIVYHPTRVWQKLQPSTVSYVLQRSMR